MTESRLKPGRLEYHKPSGRLNNMTDFTHAYCETCNAIRAVIQESLTGPDTSGKFVGDDLICNECHFIIATLYKRLDGGDTKLIAPPHYTH
jgi:hypothetical protein